MNQQQINISPKDMEDMKCEQCENDTFIQSFLLKKVSRFVTGQMEDGVIPMQVFSCYKCGHINKEFLPKSNEHK